jgi:ABC-type transport system involved in multi-copper enzyme maturation permease subunit
MHKAIRTELLKLRTTRLTAGLLAAAAAWTALVASIESSRSGISGMVPSLSGAAGERDVLTSTGFALIVAMVFGAMVTSGEFRHRTATDTYLDEPDRARVLVAKTLVAALGGALFGLVGTAITTLVGLGFTTSKGYDVVLTAGTIAGYSAGAVLGAALLAAMGAGLGALIRGQVASIIAVFAWGFGVEQIVGGLISSAAPYLPFMAAATMAGAGSGGMPPLPKDLSPLPFAGVAALLVGMVVTVGLVAARTSLEQDIS